MTRFSEIEQIVGPAQGTPPRVDWAAIEYHTGLAFPLDYKQLATKYPLLFFDEWLTVLHPSTPNPPGNPYRTADILSYAKARLPEVRTWRPTEFSVFSPGSSGTGPRQATSSKVAPFPVYPEAGGILPWGDTENNDVCCWLTDEDPEKWTVVIADQHQWWHYRGSLTSFLVDLLTRQIRCPVFPRRFPLGDTVQVEQIFD